MNTQKIDKASIRIATTDDAVHLARFYSYFENKTITAKQVETRLTATRHLETPLLAIVDDKPVGFASLRLVPALSSEAPHAEITELYIEIENQSDEHEPRIIKRALLEKAEGIAQDKGATSLTLHTGLKNKASQGLYRSLGYLDYALAMQKSLVTT
ncbi:MAG: GNAT family N-acetyltransferase [Anaerolineales bacterium]|nr:GNAT family N-acetyltransferase [Anaerolineales bacterium]